MEIPDGFRKPDEGLRPVSLLQKEMFELGWYRRLNPDLRGSDEELLEHWALHGRSEGRVASVGDLPAAFLAQEYRDLNPDLAELDDDAVVNHFLRHGRAEGRAWGLLEEERRLTERMDCQRYLTYYGMRAAPLFARWHFARHGRAERRFAFPIAASAGAAPSDALTLDEQWHHLVHRRVDYPKLLDYGYLRGVYDELDAGALSCYAPEGERYRPLRVLSSSHGFVDLLELQREAHDGRALGVPERALYPFLRHGGSGRRRRLPSAAPASATPWPCFVLNLDAATERWAAVSAHLAQLSSVVSPVTRVSAVRERPGAFGCFLSHMKALRLAERGRHVLVLEDDNVVPDAARLGRVLAALDAAPFSWDVFVGCNGNAAARVQSSLVLGDGPQALEFLRICNWTKTNLVVYHRDAVDAVLAGETLLRRFGSQLFAVDRYLNLFDCYTTLGVARVTDGFSFIEQTSDIPENDQIDFAEAQLAAQADQLT